MERESQRAVGSVSWSQARALLAVLAITTEPGLWLVRVQGRDRTVSAVFILLFPLIREDSELARSASPSFLGFRTGCLLCVALATQNRDFVHVEDLFHAGMQIQQQKPQRVISPGPEKEWRFVPIPSSYTH